MSFRGLAFDFSTLPKVKAHTQLGSLRGCSWYDPTSFGECATQAITAGQQLADMKNAVLDLANSWAAGIQDINSWPDSQEKSDALATAQSGFSEAQNLVTQLTAVQNDFNSKMSVLQNIGLAGFSSQGLGNLGVGPFVWATLGVVSLAISALVYWGIQGAQAVKSGYEANSAYYNTVAQYNAQCGQLLKNGQSCDGLVKPNPNPPGGDSTTTYLMLGIAALVAFLVIKR